MGTFRFQKTMDAISALSIDANKVSVHNLDITGYDEYVYSPPEHGGGRAVAMGDDGVPTNVFVHRPWPSEKEGLHIVDLFMQEGGYRL